MPWEEAPLTVDRPAVERPKTLDERLLSQEDALPLFRAQFRELERQVSSADAEEVFSSEQDAEERFDQAIERLRGQIGDRLRVTREERGELMRWIVDETKRIASKCPPQTKRGLFRSLTGQFSASSIISIVTPYGAETNLTREEIVALLEEQSATQETAPLTQDESPAQKEVSAEKKQEIQEKAQLLVHLLNQLTEKADLPRLDARGASEDELEKAFSLLPEEELAPCVELLSWLTDQAEDMEELPASLHHLNIRYLKSVAVERLATSGPFVPKKRLRQLQTFIAADEDYQKEKPEKLRFLEERFLLDVAHEDLADGKLPTAQRLRAVEAIAASFGNESEDNTYRKKHSSALIEKGLSDLSEKEDLSVEDYLSVCERLIEKGFIKLAFVSSFLERQGANIPEEKFGGLRKAAAEARAVDRLLKAYEIPDLFLQQVEPVLKMLREEGAPSADSERQKIADAYNEVFSQLPPADAQRIFESLPPDLRQKTYDHLPLMYRPEVVGRRAEGLDRRGEHLQEKIREKSRLNAKRIQDELAQIFSRESIQEAYEEVWKSNQITINLSSTSLESVLETGRLKSAFEEGIQKSASYLSTRYAVEKLLGIRNMEFYQDSPAIYGAIAAGGEEDRFGAAPRYGDICLRLKKEAIASRVTCVDGDSFEYRDDMNEHRFLYEDALWAKTKNVLQKKQMGIYKEYVECQILGGINVDEIEAVVVPARFKSEVEGLMAKFPTMKVEYVS